MNKRTTVSAINMNIVKLFPTSVGVFKLPKLSEDQMSWILSQDLRSNVNNKTSKNACLLDHAVLDSLRFNIESCINEYATNISKTPSNVSLKITQSWCNYARMGDSHHKHSHANSILSGVYYVQTDKEDKIHFYKSAGNVLPIQITPTEYNDFNSTSWWLPSTQGTLLLFPSHLHHSVSERTHNGPDRVSLSFNTFYTGTLGCDEELTLLHL